MNDVAALFVRADSVYKTMPVMPIVMTYASHVIGDSGRVALGNKKPEVTKAEREHTPEALAIWLVELARRCVRPQ